MLLTCLCSVALALSVFGQSPTISPQASGFATPATAAASPTPTMAASPTTSPSGSRDSEEELDRVIEKKLKKHFNISIGDEDGESGDSDASELMAIPIIGIIFTTLFGAPVMIVGLIMFFSFWKARSLHRTVRTMVEKGQEVPAALLAGAPPVVRARSDMRRGIVLVMVGIGVMIFLGATNDWEGSAWSLGVIPFLIGVGYLLVWKMEGRKDTAAPSP